MNEYYVYILTNKNHPVLYTGLTNDIEVRTLQHKTKEDAKSFTAQYNVDKLLHFEDYNDINEAIAREKQIKKWSRKSKVALIDSHNPQWRDLSEGWYAE